MKEYGVTIGYPVLAGDQYPVLLCPEQLLRSTMFETYAQTKESFVAKDDEKHKEDKEKLEVVDLKENKRGLGDKQLFCYWAEVVVYLNKVYFEKARKNCVKMEVECHEIFDEVANLVHPDLNIGDNWRTFQSFCKTKRANFLSIEPRKGKRSSVRTLFVLREDKRDDVCLEILNTLKNHHKNIEQLKEEGLEIVGYARKSPGKEELKNRFTNLFNMAQNLLKHSHCDQIFISPTSLCAETLYNRDQDSDFIGNTDDMVGYITTSKHNLCLVILDYAGLCSRGSIVKSFLLNHPNVKKVIVDLYNSERKFVLLESVEVIKDPSKFEECRVGYIKRSL